MFRTGLLMALVATSLASTATALAAPPKMQAIVQTNGTEIAGLELQTVDTPVPAAGQVLIRVRAAGVNPVDWKRRAPPQAGGATIPGFDAAGVIDSVGPGVTAFKAGDAVFARVNGSYAQYAAVEADSVVRKPARFSFEQAAGIPVAGLAGFRAVEAAQLRRGQRVAIIGAAGGAGSAAVEMAKLRGARVVAVGHSSQEAYLKALGADEFLAYDKQKVAELVKDVDAVLNMVDGQADPAVRYVRRGGFLTSIAGGANAEACATAGLTCIQIGPAYRGPRSEVDMLRDLAKFADEGKYTVKVTKTFPLAEAAAAQTLGHDGDTIGKIVLVID
jgi:NADPH:quinone reductase-like Zn-dependent oxidoreductase